MTSPERSHISNGIWLCANCHKLIDDDPERYPPGLLFEWQLSHERSIASQLGKAAAQVRTHYEDRHLEELGRLSSLARRLVLEREEYWEYLLTVEVLRFEVGPILRRWSSLDRGHYAKPLVRVRRHMIIEWLSDRLSEIQLIVAAFSGVVNEEFRKAWGDPGVPGDDLAIVSTCRLLAEACQSALDWEERVRFTRMDDDQEEIRVLLVGIAGRLLDQAEKIPEFLAQTVAERPTEGSYALELVLDLPRGWIEAVELAMGTAGAFKEH